jgi:glycosyltransferase involved in cell wall biosynthesis
MELVILQWSPSQRRTSTLADILAVEPHFIFPRPRRRGPLAALRYIPSFFSTVQIVLALRPSLVIAVLPPFFPALAVECCRLLGRRFTLLYDAHSGAILDGKWRWSVPLLRRLIRRRTTGVIVTNAALAEAAGLRGNVFVLPDPIPAGPSAPKDPDAARSGYVFVVNTFSPDEPLGELLDAARQMPHLQFRVSGRIPKRTASLLATAPTNVTFTDYLSDSDYWAQLRGALVAVVLTSRPMTLLSGAYEALAAGTPLVLSEQAVLVDYFRGPALFTENRARAIAACLSTAIDQRASLSSQIPPFRDRRNREWDDRLRAILQFCGNPSPVGQAVDHTRGA